MKKGLTELVFILDMSGSMSNLTDDTIGGYNSLIRAHKEDEGECLVSTIFFNDEARVIHDRVPIEKVKDITGEDYRAMGCTALVDAFAGAIHHIAMVHKYAREEDVPEKTIFTVITDGYENASYKYTSRELQQMVRHEREKYGWEFMFVGANIDSFAMAETYGIDQRRVANYMPDSAGSSRVYGGITKASRAMKNLSCEEAEYSVCDAIRDINDDYESRKKR